MTSFSSKHSGTSYLQTCASCLNFNSNLEHLAQSSSATVDSTDLFICFVSLLPPPPPPPAPAHFALPPSLCPSSSRSSSSPSLPPFLPASDNVTFCQSAGNHATVAAGSSVAATEIDSNKCRERKRKGGGRGREEEGHKGERKKEEKGKEWGGGKKNGNRTAEVADTGWVVTSQGWMWIANTGNGSLSSTT